MEGGLQLADLNKNPCKKHIRSTAMICYFCQLSIILWHTNHSKHNGKHRIRWDVWTLYPQLSDGLLHNLQYHYIFVDVFVLRLIFSVFVYLSDIEYQGDWETRPSSGCSLNSKQQGTQSTSSSPRHQYTLSSQLSKILKQGWERRERLKAARKTWWIFYSHPLRTAVLCEYYPKGTQSFWPHLAIPTLQMSRT